MDMKWILTGCIGIMLAACSSNKNNDERLMQLHKEAARVYCECIFGDTLKFTGEDSCVALSNKIVEPVKTDSIDSDLLVYRELEANCPGWKELMQRQYQRLNDAATKMAQDRSYQPTPSDNEHSGTLLSWQKLPKGEGEYELVMRSAKDSTTYTFITQAKPPKGAEPHTIYVTFEPNEAAYHEKYPYRAVQVRFTHKN